MSLSSEFLAANPPTEFDEIQGYSQQIASADAERFVEWLETEGHRRPVNLNIVADFLNENGWPIIFRNLRIAYFWTRAEGLHVYGEPEVEEPEQAKIKYTGPTVQRAFLSPEAQQEEADLVSTLRELDRVAPARQDSWKRPTVDVSPEFRELVHKSRAANRNGGKVRHMSEAEARAQIAIQMPHLRIDSPEYNMWTARLQFNQNSND